MRITLNPSRPDRAKLHMEAAWHFIYHREKTEDVEVYTFKHFGVGVYRSGNDIETRETGNA